MVVLNQMIMDRFSYADDHVTLLRAVLYCRFNTIDLYTLELL